LKEKIKTMIALNFVGESLSVKNGNLLVTVTDEIEVEALPADLPEHIEVELSVLEELDSIITVADLNIDKSNIEVLTHEEQLVAKTEEPKEEEEIPEEEELSPEDVEATAQKGDKEDGEGEDTGEGKDEKNKKGEEKVENKEEKKEESKKE
jgi:large subunit ribosomal protein L25